MFKMFTLYGMWRFTIKLCNYAMMVTTIAGIVLVTMLLKLTYGLSIQV